MIRAFIAGFLAGIAVTFWLIARSIATPDERPADEAVRDPYLDDLAAILEREHW